MPDSEIPSNALTLENDALSLAVLPEQGGKLISLVSQRTHTEWLLPPLRDYRTARLDGSFPESDCGGFDECLPTVAPSGEAPDHGEVWRVPWTGGKRDGSIDLSVETRFPPLRFARTATLADSTVLLRYSVENPASTPAEFLWSSHPAFSVQEGDRVVLPPEVTRVRIEHSNNGRIPGDACAWPTAADRDGNPVDLSRVGAFDGRTAEKLFAGPLQQAGWCALYRPAVQQGIVLRFDPRTVPYVGLWLCRGGWPESGTLKQYAVALEPTTANCDALEMAKRNGTATRLHPGQRLEWSLEISVLGNDQAMDYDTFCAAAAGAQQ